jgi:hypothetical protein
LLSGQAAAGAFPVKAEFAGRVLQTTVDSEIAQYYLEHYLQDRRIRAPLDERIHALLGQASAAPPDRDSLKTLAQRASPDFAALYFAQAVLAEPCNRAAQQFFDREAARLAPASRGAALATLRAHADRYALLFVPGWVYRSEPGNGADLPATRAALSRAGFETRLVEIAESGTIEANAETVAQAIRRHARGDKRLIVVSASSGGPSTALALGERLRAEETGALAAWVNVGGLLQGSALVDHAQRWPARWLTRTLMFFKGWDFASVRSMATAVSRARYARLRLPPLPVVNYLGVPMSGDVSDRARSGYRELLPEGPNDGLTLLPDALVARAVTVLELGRDHYLTDPRIEEKSLALAALVIRGADARTIACNSPM